MSADARSRLALDASAALLCVLDAPGSTGADEVLGSLRRSVVVAPELWLAEVANALWKRTRRGPTPLDPVVASELLDVLMTMPVRLVPHAPIAARALDLALAEGITVYDALYLAVAEREDAALVTADLALAEAAVRAGVPVARPATTLTM
ncbi:MAG TPA: type II toxin-antitoxin system VapC family toxin [Longimicrobiales bacterium]|nr:type II toxin-antitoxin system VapC family toxin [Longimicrobiales bacterium]